MNEERVHLPFRAAAGTHSHPSAPAALSITGAEIPGIRQVALHLGLLFGRQDPSGLKPMLYRHFLKLGAKVVDLFLLRYEVLFIRIRLSPERAELSISA